MLTWLRDRTLSVIPGFLGAVGGLCFAVAVLHVGWWQPMIWSGAAMVITGCVYLRGRHLAASRPRPALRWLESTYPLLIEFAAVATGIVLWVGIRYAPPKHATIEREHLGAAVIALGALLATAVTKPLESGDDPGGLIRSAYQRALRSRFASSDVKNPDAVNLAYDALWEEEYSDGTQTITGWSWRMRRKRATHLENGLSA